jgi:hypothetical protein
MNTWKRLDLRKTDQRPDVDTLVALRIVPKDRRAAFAYGDGYDIGKFETDRGGKKLWFRHSHGVSDPVRMKKQCNVWWCYLAPFDGI